MYDPTCGSGSLLLKVADEARSRLTMYGHKKDFSTAGLARTTKGLLLLRPALASLVQ